MKGKKRKSALFYTTKFDIWSVISYRGMRLDDRVLLGLLIIDWLRGKRRLEYGLKTLANVLGLSKHRLRKGLQRLEEGRWVEFETRQGGVYPNLFIDLTLNTIKVFHLPFPKIPVGNYELPPAVATRLEQLRRKRDDASNLNLASHILSSNTNRIHLKEEELRLRAEENSSSHSSAGRKGKKRTDTVGVPSSEAQQLIDVWEQEWMQALGYSTPKRYTEDQMISEAEDCVAKHSVEEWRACLEWARRIKKRLVKNDYVARMPIIRLSTLHTLWNMFVDATALGEVAHGKQSSVYDQGGMHG